ncbi:uncharacterized protein LOC126914700 isoform X4 [Bombus affinis]|uniref:uncharacterized protein LOC126914700 isoform X3 n=1 Tax=Bombus affinis TaxID=309941 RepID=UPI0021B778AC|nr:uncharacterized protein LOC126914700 isoform X3 [Bombus affinis]XP_050574984.1 uncharacterized protein LOC126914700 isoform X4 [Bombus affinis]
MFFSYRSEMDVFYRQYNTYRILLSVVGLWPYHKTIYSTIHRILISVIILAYIVFQVLSLYKSGITFRGCIITLSATCPITAILMRYVSSAAVFPATECLFDYLRTTETMLKDQFEIYILMKYVDYSTSIIHIFLCLCCSWTLLAASYVFTPITLDLLMPLNESRRRYFSLLTMFSHDRIEYVDMVCVNILVIYTIGLLCVAGTDLTFVVFAHYICGMFEITSYRMRKTIAGLSSSRQIDPNFRDFRYVVDNHRNTLLFINYLLSNYRIHYLLPSAVAVVSVSVSLHRLSRTITDAEDEKEIFICIFFLISHLVFLYISCSSGQIIIDRSLNVFKESYNSTWYCMPVEAQKLLLFIMLRSSTESIVNIFGFFVASHAGFTTLLSTSFSYFTVIYSSQ